MVVLEMVVEVAPMEPTTSLLPEDIPLPILQALLNLLDVPKR
jgi:hypothetical protein